MQKIVLAAAASLSLAACGGPAVDATSAATARSAHASGGVCEPQTSDLIAGQHIDAGSVIITNDGESLIVEVVTDAPWTLSELHVWAGTGAPPTNKKGTVVPGHFPYALSLDGASSATLSIALADLDIVCGEALKVITHAVVDSTGPGGTGESQTAFGDGTPFSGPRWGFTASYDTCCEDETCQNKDGAYYTANTDWPAFSPESAFCYAEPTSGIPTMGAVLASSATDAFTLLAREFVLAKLNVSCTPWHGDVGGAMVAANSILSDCAVSEGEAAEAASLTAILSAYNAL